MVETRRNFIKKSVVAFGGLMVFSCESFEQSNYKFFTEEQARCMIAICEQIIPANEYGGATEAGVINYIDNQLVGHYSSKKELYKRGIEAIQENCLDQKNKVFEELSFERQKEFLQKMELDQHPPTLWDGISQSSFFKMMIQHTMEGFYGSPKYGGNKDYLSYKMMHLSYPLVLGQPLYKNNTT